MNEELFNNWKFLYENSEDISLHIEFYREGREDPSLVADISSDDFKNAVGKDSAVHIEFDGSFDMTIHAIKDNEVYVSLLMRTSEYGWKKYQAVVENTTEKNVTIVAESENYDQLGYFIAKIKLEGYLINVVSSSGQKSGDTVKVTIEGVLP